jgi:Ca2+-binding EF-hand superfamily protein
VILNEIQDLVSGLDGVMFNDLMENIEWFFNLHDKNKDGYLTKDEVLTLCESFLVRCYECFLELCSDVDPR